MKLTKKSWMFHLLFAMTMTIIPMLMDQYHSMNNNSQQRWFLYCSAFTMLPMKQQQRKTTTTTLFDRRRRNNHRFRSRYSKLLRIQQSGRYRDNGNHYDRQPKFGNNGTMTSTATSSGTSTNGLFWKPDATEVSIRAAVPPPLPSLLSIPKTALQPIHSTTSSSSSSSSSTALSASASISNDSGDIVNSKQEESNPPAEINKKDKDNKGEIINKSLAGIDYDIHSVSDWHRLRRKFMVAKYGNQILQLEGQSNSGILGLFLLMLSNTSLLLLAMKSATLSISQVFALSLFPGSIFSLWQLQILHDVLHGSLLSKRKKTITRNHHQNQNNNNNNITLQNKLLQKGASFNDKKKLEHMLLFWGSMPSYFGYYLYLKYGHLTHHANLGVSGDRNEDNMKAGKATVDLKQVFGSTSRDFEDGDLLFVAHRMKLKGKNGPIVFNRDMSISRKAFSFWRDNQPIRNGSIFITSFLLERIMLGINDIAVAITGHNYFFPNKPINTFHNPVTWYCRLAVLVRALIWYISGSWKSLLFLFLSETLWSLPPHPACAMFITNHGSTTTKQEDGKESCIPTSSTYAGKWYSLLTLGTNYHCEHHDFPTIPLHQLHKLHQIAPEFYTAAHACNSIIDDNTKGRGSTKKDNVFKIMYNAFRQPQYYACMDAGLLAGSVGSAS